MRARLIIHTVFKSSIVCSMDGLLARKAQQRSLQRGTWYQEAPSLIRKRHVFGETKAAKKEKSDSSSSSGSETEGGNKKDKSKKKDKKDKKKKKKGRCWEGYEPTPGVEAYAEGSCRKK